MLIVPDEQNIIIQVFEFLEDLSASLSDLAMRELNVLKDYKVSFFLAYTL